MTVAALHNPVAAGKELTYEISVVNNTGAAASRGDGHGHCARRA